MADAQTARRGSYRWLIFAVLAAAYVLVYFHRLCAAVLGADMMRDLKIDGEKLGLLTALYFYPYALMQLPAGLLSDSWGPRRTITAFFTLAFLGSILLGLAPTYGWALAGRTLVGIGVAMLFVPTMKVLAEWFTPKEFAGMTGIMVAMGGIGSLSATTPLARLSTAVGWRGSFLIVGAATLLIAILVWLIVRDRPPSENESVRGCPHPRTTDNSISLSAGVKLVLSTPAFWPLAAWFFFGCGIYFAFIGLWGGPFFMHVYGMTKPQASNVLAFAAVGMVIGSPLLGWLSNRVFRARKPLLIASGTMAVALTAVLAFHPAGLPVWSLYLISLLMGVFLNGMVTIGFTAAKELFPLAIAGTSTGLVNFFPFLGGAIFPILLGRILDHAGKTPIIDSAGKTIEAFTTTGYAHAHLVLFLSAIIAAIAALFVKETLTERS